MNEANLTKTHSKNFRVRFRLFENGRIEVRIMNHIRKRDFIIGVLFQCEYAFLRVFCDICAENRLKSERAPFCQLVEVSFLEHSWFFLEAAFALAVEERTCGWSKVHRKNGYTILFDGHCSTISSVSATSMLRASVTLNALIILLNASTSSSISSPVFMSMFCLR